jgi:hypothetical protein
MVKAYGSVDGYLQDGLGLAIQEVHVLRDELLE